MYFCIYKDFFNTFLRYHHSDEREEIKQKVISIYQDLKTFLKSDEYTEDLKNELQQSYPDYLEVLEKRIGDMEKSDHGIVIAGKVEIKLT